MSGKQVVIGTYNHLPNGLNTGVFETIYQTCYRPFLIALHRFPDINAFLYYSGILMETLEVKHPEFLMLLEELITRKQVELAGGGFHAPIMPLIPAQDRIGQIELLTTHIRKHFGKRPRGAWLYNYAWEPSLTSTLRTSGMDYTFLLDRHFRQTGSESEKFLTPAITEDQGRMVSIYPVIDGEYSFNKRLGFLEMLHEVKSNLKTENDNGYQCLMLMLPGESAHHLWKESDCETPDLYFEKVFSRLSKMSNEFETTIASKYFRSHKTFQRAYFPCCATDKLLNSNLHNPDFKDNSNKRNDSAFYGSSRNAFLRTQESINLYSKMQYVHLQVGQLRGDKSRKTTAKESLWASQVGDAYWFSGLNGLLDISVRNEAYRSLIEAEQTIRSKNSYKPHIINADIDFDNNAETLFQGQDYNAYLTPKGASLFELDVLKARRNYTSALFYPCNGIVSNCFNDYLELIGNQGNVMAKIDLTKLVFAQNETKKPDSEVAFYTDITFSGDDGLIPLRLEKIYTFKKNAFQLVYSVSNQSDISVNCILKSLSSWTPSTDLQNLKCTANSQNEILNVDLQSGNSYEQISRISFEIQNDNNIFSLAFDKEAVISSEVILTKIEKTNYQDNEKELIQLFQGIHLISQWTFLLKPEKNWQVRILIEFGTE